MKALLVLAVLISCVNVSQSQTSPTWVRTSHVGGLSAIALTGESKYLASTSVRNDEIIVWDGQTGAYLRRAPLNILRGPYAQHLEIVTARGMSGTQMIAIGTDSGIYIYDVDRMEISERITGTETRDVGYLAISTSNDTLLWITHSGAVYRYSRLNHGIVDQLRFEGGPMQYFEPPDNVRVVVSNDLGVVAYKDYDLFIADFDHDTTLKVYDERFGDLQSVSEDKSLLIFNDKERKHRDALRLLDLQFIDSFAQGVGALPSPLVTRDAKITYVVRNYSTANVRGALYGDILRVKGTDTSQITGLNGAIAVDPINPIISVGSGRGSASYTVDGLPLSVPALSGWNYGGLMGINYAYTGELCGHRLGGDERIEGYLFVGRWTATNHIPTWGICYNAPKLDPAAPRVAVGLDIIRIDTTYADYQSPCPLITAEWTPSGSHYVWSEFNDSLVFQDRNNNTRFVPTGHRKINEIATSSRNDLIATCGIDSTIKLWTIDGQLVKTFIGHTGAVNDVNFAPNGRQLVSASSDSTVRVWDIDKGEIYKYTEFKEPFYQAAVSNDGLAVIAASDRSIVGFSAADWASVKRLDAPATHAIIASRSEHTLTITHDFSIAKPVLLEIYDVLGRLLLKSEFSNAGTITINTDVYGAQALLVKLTQDGESASVMVPRF